MFNKFSHFDSNYMNFGSVIAFLALNGRLSTDKNGNRFLVNSKGDDVSVSSGQMLNFNSANNEYLSTQVYNYGTYYAFSVDFIRRVSGVAYIYADDTLGIFINGDTLYIKIDGNTHSIHNVSIYNTLIQLTVVNNGLNTLVFNRDMLIASLPSPVSDFGSNATYSYIGSNGSDYYFKGSVGNVIFYDFIPSIQDIQKRVNYPEMYAYEKPINGLESVDIPEYNSSNPEHVLITPTNGNWTNSVLNNTSYKHFYIEAGKYTSRITLTTSGTETDRRTLSLYNGNDTHPASLPDNEQADLAIWFDNASYWILDRISNIDDDNGYAMRFDNGSSYNIVNREYVKNYFNGIRIANLCHYNTIQNSYIDTSTHNGRTHDSVAIVITLKQEGERVYGTKILNNDIRNAGDGFQIARASVDNNYVVDVGADGTIVDNNRIWVDEGIFTDGNYAIDGYSNNPDSHYMVCENAMDFKVGSLDDNNPVIITNNYMWGYRRGDGTTGGLQSTGRTPVIVAHIGTARVHFKNNVIFDSETAFNIGDNFNLPYAAYKWEIENNVFANIGTNIFDDMSTRPFMIIDSNHMKLNNNLFMNFGENINGESNSLRLGFFDDSEVKNNVLVNTHDIVAYEHSGHEAIYSNNHYYNVKERFQKDTNFSANTNFSVDDITQFDDFTIDYHRFLKEPKSTTLFKVLENK